MPNYQHNSLEDCIKFIKSAPQICMPNYTSKLNYVLGYLIERGAAGFSVFVAKNPDASTEDLVQDVFRHLEATSRLEDGVDLASLRI